ncbi:ATP-binding cassette domain-containing protein [Leifsonia sp. H3M29-4]|uniref:ABC transporter ATP-binding protein n=1 Tax=Salinibacterium metalliresistens TaxID=3031321 RepID=UPI0023DB0A68|nr:ATP-binding cassette domain-containing protein [Salinibacterium metalliresistens]MDF1478571.1 ATP-binding cassette domain-containing protein [Salinibacterium metalliresistens]
MQASGWGWRHAARLAWATRGLDLRIEPGERVLLLGASGAGKSTLLRALAGVLGADEGEQEGSLTIDGEAPAAARGRAGLVLQDPDSQVILARVGDDVAFGCENLGVPREQIWPRVAEALEAVGLDVALDRSTSALSGGQRQRLALAGVLAMRPGLLLLDEPTANLDPAGVVEVRDAVGRVLDATDATLVVVEHRVATWLPIVDRVVVLAPEGVVADGSPDAVLGWRGAELAAQGIWVPGHPPARPARLPEAGEPLLEARELVVGRERVPVREGIDVTARASQLLAVTGPNGAGKSTLGLTLAGLLPPVGGELRATDVLAAGAGPSPHRWRSRELLTRIGTVFQDPEHQFLARTVREELEVGPHALKAPRPELVDELLERLRLTRLAKANPFTLSGGEQRRLSVATALATRPRLLVLDEPTFGQDAVTWAELVALIAELLAEGTGVVAATHDAEFVDALAGARLELS